MNVPTSDDKPFVSVIIPVRDNPSGIRDVLECLARQTLAPDRFEVVIGDDGSQGAQLEEGSADRVRVSVGPPRTSYAARNRAARLSCGSILAFCDSDCLPEPTWLEEGVAALGGGDIVAGEVRLLVPTRLTVWSLLTLDMFFDQERNVRLGRGVTANLIVKRDLFEELGGFDESLPSGGDYDFVARSLEHDACLIYAPRAVVRHPTFSQRRAFLRKIWTTNRWDGVRRARSRLRPQRSAALTLVPILGVIRARHEAQRPAFSLYRPRLRACGLTPSWWYDLRALPVLYFLVSPIAAWGRLLGWWTGYGLARRGATPSYGYPPRLPEKPAPTTAISLA